MESVCRVCMLRSGGMFNIFDGTSESGVSIAELVAQYTGFQVKRGDSFPETICPLCLQDARKRLEETQSSEKHHQQVHTQVKQEFLEIEDCKIVIPECQIKEELSDPGEELLKEQVCEVTDSETETSSSEEESYHQLDFQVKHENDDNDSRHRQQIYPQFDAIVKTERAEEEEDGISEDQSEESNSDQHSDFLVKEEEQEESVDADEDNDNQPFKCPYCPNRYSRKANLNIHIRTHTGFMPYHCALCPKAFNTKRGLNEHFRIHTGERPHNCPQCGKAFRTRVGMRHHELTHSEDRPNKCMYCPKSFVKLSRLRRHIRTHTSERTYNCTRCPAKFPLKELRREHSRIHKKDPEESFVCPQCSKAWRNKSSLVCHLKTHCEDRPFRCIQCPNTFKDGHALRIHMLTHSEEKSFPCPQCPKAFKQKQSLRRHQISTHQAEKK